MAFIRKSIYFILIFFIGLFIVSSFFVRAKYNFIVYGDNPILERQNIPLFVCIMVLLSSVSIVLYRLSLWLNKFPAKGVVPVVLALSFALQIGIMLAFPRLPTDDSQTVLSLAKEMLYNHDYSSFQAGGYLHMFPFNFSMVLYLKSLLALFPDKLILVKLFNSLFTLVTTLMIYLIYKTLHVRSASRDYGVLLFAAMYAPALLMNNLIYNDVIATAFLTSALYFVIRFVRDKRIAFLIIAAVLLSIGNYFRGIGVIVLIAAVIYMFLHAREIGVRKSLIAAFVLVLMLQIPGWTQNFVLQRMNIVDESLSKNAAPVYMWLNMGINKERFGFWDNRASYNIYEREAGYNKEMSEALFKQEIRDKLSEMSFGDLSAMYYKKLIWVWTEGTYQVDRYGIGTQGSDQRGRRGGSSIMGEYSYSTFFTELFKGDSKYRSGFLMILYVMNILMYIFIFIRLYKGLRKKSFDEMPLVLVILGFIGFYLLWEIKSRYLFPVYPILIMLSFLGFKDTYEYVTCRRIAVNE
ncbi:glycosyltransferase family 39 protein [Paenibacillus sp. HB172176]|uniref:glycosyltransferase family 39 protein n=1 Tax=Paenibacillus sp. HB172176 TaxID=2493690 RepID=UPI00143B4405|nr:glycosyltransferase family 39 protein [Paenibacillus sp. HB172176]